MRVRRHPQHRIALAALAVAAAGVPIARAGTILDSVPDSSYTALAADPKYQAVGQLNYSRGTSNYLASGTLITSEWVLTAAHVVYDPAPSNMVFKVGGTNYTGASWVYYPSWEGNAWSGYDIGLIKLATPVSGITPASRYTGTDELGSVGTSVGYGQTGTGLTGDVAYTSGTKRAGQNMIDALGSNFLESDAILICDFDNPDQTASHVGDSTPLPLEYLIAHGDSGGGQFIDVNGQARVAGVNSFVMNWDGSTNSSYSDAQGATRVSQFNAWIDDTISVGWSTAGGGAYSSGANWAGGVAPGANDVVGFNQSGTYTVTFAGPATGERLLVRNGRVTLDLGGSTYSLTSAMAEGSVVVGKYSGNAARLTVQNGTMSTRDVVVGELAGSTGRITVTGSGTQWNATGSVYVGGSSTSAGGSGTLTINSGANLAATDTVKLWSGGSASVSGTLSAGKFDFSGGSLTVQSGGVTAVNPHSGGVMTTITAPADQLTIAGNAGAWLGRFDLANNTLVLQDPTSGGTHADVVSRVLDQLTSGRAGGAWDGPGIESSTAATHPGTGLGWRDGGSSVTVAYTWAGDANLDHAVNFNDLLALAQHYGTTSGSTWATGDFNYDGAVNFNDLLALAQHYGQMPGGLTGADLILGGAFSPSFADVSPNFVGDVQTAFAMAAVPEPASLGVLVVGAMGLLARRRKQ